MIELIRVLFTIVAILGAITFLIIPILYSFYFNKGIFANLFHNKLGMHRPDLTQCTWYTDGSVDTICKYCGKTVSRDGKGVWHNI